MQFSRMTPSIGGAFTSNIGFNKINKLKQFNLKRNLLDTDMEIDMQTFLQHEFDESTFTLDTEARREMRMKRLNHRHIETEKVEEEAWIPSVQKQFQQKEKESKILGQTFLQDICQHNSILSDAPAICLEPGAGTGKTTVLAGRNSHLLRAKQIEQKNMIILSFTKRDAVALKEKAMNILHQDSSCKLPERADLENQLWCGTIHSFAINILRKCNCNDISLRIISNKEMKNRVRNCLGRINGSKEKIMLFRNALEDSRHSIVTLVQYIVRCLELWKEAEILSTPYAYSINFGNDVKEASSSHDTLSKDDYVELAMRLGVPQNAALMALDIRHSSCYIDDISPLTAIDGNKKNPNYPPQILNHSHFNGIISLSLSLTHSLSIYIYIYIYHMVLQNKSGAIK